MRLTNAQRGATSQLAYKQSEHSAAQDGALLWDAAAARPVVSKSGAFVGLATTDALGYATGAGGAVTQATSKSTGVTLNRRAGVITTDAANLGAGNTAVFTVTNSTVAAADVPLVAVVSPSSKYRAAVSAVAPGSFQIALENATAGALAEAVVINFVVLTGAAA